MRHWLEKRNGFQDEYTPPTRSWDITPLSQEMQNRALSGLEFTAHELWPVFDHPPKKLRDSLVVDVGHLLYRPFLWKALQTIRFEVDTVSQIYMRMKRR